MRHLVAHFGSLSMDAPPSRWETHWHGYQKARLEKVSKSTLGCELSCLKTVLNEAMSARLDRSSRPMRFSRSNPMNDVTVAGKIGHTQKKQRAIFTPSELEAIYAVASPRNAALWKFMANTGLRRGEVLGLQKRFISKDSIQIVHDPDQGLMTKTNRSRVVPLNEAAQEALRALRTVSMDSDLLVPWADKWTLSRAFKADREAVGLDGGVLHSLRHSFISHLLNDRLVSVKTVMKIVGHTQIKTTESYLSSTDEELHAAVAGLSL
jgi:integrase